MRSPVNLRVAVVGAGPAGIYASDILSRTLPGTAIDLFDRLPAPYGLVRYGVAPDHPRIKAIVAALDKILARGDVRLIGNVDVGDEIGGITIQELGTLYDGVILATGAIRDADLDIPGIDLPGSFGAADFVSWFDGHPDVPRTWPLEASQIAVIGAGNVALDVARMLAKHVEDLSATEIPANVAEGLAASPVTDVHVFARRGPAQAKFSPLELRELGHVPDVDVLVYPEDFEFDAGSEAAMAASNQTRQVVATLTDWALKDPEEARASRRLHLHFLHRPVEVLGEAGPDGVTRVSALRTERTTLAGDGSAVGTGVLVDTPVQAVYRAVGYFGSPVPGVPFDHVAGVIPNDGGRVLGEDGAPIPGLYATGWIKRGPVGLIGSTKSDAQETIRNLAEDVGAGVGLRAGGAGAGADSGVDVIDLLEERGVPVTTWSGWELLQAHERALGEAEGRERVKVVPREEMTAISRGALVS
ncbi:pyridine nucleotide-disulfide oxidoreductase [Miniimonas arenae]|uniref:ferredoxin--NADP(+) reductase n=1 Tax=Miniimonas arenae TaxID=676201 RepID=A0A5C5BB89_9MICO|nr:FAD-dependent oxidoreductase [Miniimonas arenae]TNU73784.1 pyridine nucleotide-disulfide oxidoreductase [Miniimonas arenae]